MGMNHCAESRIKHEKLLLLAKKRLDELEKEKTGYEIEIMKIKEKELID